MDLTMSSAQGATNMLREYRKGNWTVQETMVLIEAKKMDDERRMKRSVGDSSSKPAELRWKWVEDYCYRKGCLRSQNQCNDKWDNLMRDFKKVREYERKVSEGGEHESKSYWRIEKNERKDNNLPSNMLIQIYEALVEVVERKSQRLVVVEKPTSSNVVLGQQHHSFVTPPTYHHTVQPPAAMLLPPPHPPPSVTAEMPSIPFSQAPVPTVDINSDTSHEYSDSPAKRRKKRVGEGTSNVASSGDGNKMQQEVGSAISKSASIIAEAIQSREEREERRHREMLSLHERRLRIEESKAEINRQGINGLVDAINKLANSILALASNNSKNPSSSSK